MGQKKFIMNHIQPTKIRCILFDKWQIQPHPLLSKCKGNNTDECEVVFIKSQLEIVTEKIHNVIIISDHFDQFTVLMISLYLFP